MKGCHLCMLCLLINILSYSSEGKKKIKNEGLNESKNNFSAKIFKMENANPSISLD